MFLSTRRLFATVLLLSLFVLTVHEIVDPDYWWHLRTGEYILQNKSVPHTDIFSFTSSGKEWVAHEWLSEVLMYSLYRASGHAGVILFFSLIIAAAFWIAYRRCAGKPFVAGFAVFLGALASAPTLGARPQMFTVLFASMFLAVLGGYGKHGNSRWLWWLVPWMLVWVNLHGGYALGLGLILLTGVGVVLDGLQEGTAPGAIGRRLRPLVLVFAVCALVVLINPNGARLYTYPLEALKSSALDIYIREWGSPNFHVLAFQFLALLILATFAILAVSPKRARLSELLLLVVTCYGALRSGRHMPIFALVAVPLLAEHALLWISCYRWGQWANQPEKPLVPAKAILNALFLAVLLVAGVARIRQALLDQHTGEARRWPLAAVQFMRAQALPQPIFNNYDWGGYLIWKLYPQYKVYVDGRNDVHGDALVVEAVETYRGTGNWKAALDRWSIRTVLVAPKSPLANLLQQEPGWTKVFEDDQIVVLSKRM